MGEELTATCFGPTCSHKDPKATGCANDAKTLESVGGPQGRVLSLRYSPTCRAAWAKLEHGEVEDLIFINNDLGEQDGNEITSGTEAYTRMLNDKDTKAWASARAGGEGGFEFHTGKH
jgi:hypothetical protein